MTAEEKIIEHKAKDLATQYLQGALQVCRNCKQILPLDAYHNEKNAKKGRKKVCKECSNEKRYFRKKIKGGRRQDKNRLATKDKIYTEGEITLHNYKEPLVEIADGYGYYGTLATTIDGEYIQCHICGELYKNLSGHIWNAHHMRAKEYKEEFGLSKGNALISENTRQHFKQQTLDWLKTLTDEQKEEYQKKALAGWKKAVKEKRTTKGQTESLERKNKKGTCPEQVLDKIREAHDKLGATPSKKEFIDYCGSQRYVHLIYKLFGSWTKAVELAGLKPKQYTPHKKGGKKYSDQELLDLLVVHTLQEKKIPTATDFRRGVLPSYALYTNRWGSIENARVEAGVYEVLEEMNETSSPLR